MAGAGKGARHPAAVTMLCDLDCRGPEWIKSGGRSMFAIGPLMPDEQTSVSALGWSVQCQLQTFRKVLLMKQTKKLEKGNHGACEYGKDCNRLDEPISLDCYNAPLRSLLEGCRPR